MKASGSTNTNALFNAQVGGVLGQNAVENNALDRLDGFTPGERSLRDRADKIYQNNQKDKDLYIRAYEAYELKASYLAAKEIVVGTWEGIRHPWDNTIVPLVEAVSSPVQTTNKIVMSYENWKAVRDEAYISDPQLAGRMDAMFDARVGANAAFMVVSGGTASAIARSPAAAKVVKSAGNLSKKGLTLVYINGKLKLGPSSLPSSALKAPVPIVRKAEAPSGKAVPVGEARIPQSPQAVKGTTVTLAQEQRLANGELIPKGSKVTWSDNAVNVVRLDGSKRVFNSRDWEQKALPKPQLPKDYRYDPNIGKNNPNFNKELHKKIYDQDPRGIEAVKAREQVNKANRERIKKSPHSLVLEKDVHGNEIFYRRMSEEDFMEFQQKGKLPATSETFISPLKAYSEQGYTGVLVKFTTKPGTMEVLKKIGTTGNSATNRLFPDLPRTGKGWTEKTQVQFKLEGQGKPYVNKGKGVVNTGLGRAGGKETFEKQIIHFEKIGDIK